MSLVAGGLGLVVLVLWVYCLVDAITSDADAVRNLPKPLWVLVVLLLPTVGSLAWLFLGRPQGPRARPGGLPSRGRGAPPPGGTGGPRPAPPRGPDDDAAFQERLRRRVEEQRRRAGQDDDGAGTG